MKKLVLFFAVVAAVSFASCSGNKPAETAAPAADSAAVVDTVAVVDSAAADTAVAQ